MILKSLSGLSLGLVLGLVACSGDDGARGATGEPGQDGQDGEDGRDGEPGEDGEPGDPAAGTAQSLVLVRAEPAGENCPGGGQAIEIGLDQDGDGELDSDEIEETSYLCNSGNSLVAVAEEPAGEHCEAGGQRIQTGVDTDFSGSLDQDEVAAGTVQYLCNAASANQERLAWFADYPTPRDLALASQATVDAAPDATNAVVLNLVGRTPWTLDRFDQAAAEIVTFKAATAEVFAVNASEATIDVGVIANDGSIALGAPIDVVADIGAAVGADVGINSVAYSASDDVLAVAVELSIDGVQQQGLVAFYDISGAAALLLNTVEAGVLPDMLTFNSDGSKLLLANEGEPPADYSVDPEGTVSIINRPGEGWAEVDDTDTTTLDFLDFNLGGDRQAEYPEDIRHVGPESSTRSQTLEPEYIAVAPDDSEAWVVLQEQNAIAVIDLASDSIRELYSLGTKNALDAGNGFDASDDDEGVRIINWPVYMLYQPDTIQSYEVNGTTYYLSANEGDARGDDWSWYEEARVADIVLDPAAFPNAAYWQNDSRLGRLGITTSMGDTDADGDFDDLYAFGARSFSVWANDGTLVWDSGSEFESITASLHGDDFNNTNDENAGDSRSDAKGPEPEALAVGVVGDASYAFIGLERIGGIMVYDVSDPMAPTLVSYFNDRDFTAEVGVDDAGDLAPESLVFVNPSDSPTGTPLLIAGYEVSGTVAVYEVTTP